MKVLDMKAKTIVPEQMERNKMTLEEIYDSLQNQLPEYADISFSQEGEDILIKRLLKTLYSEVGSYVDVGAFHPRRFSNTAHYYMRGWNGINIEPNPNAIQLFENERPRDVNLSLAIGESGEEIYHAFKEPAFNTFVKDNVQFAMGKTELLGMYSIPKRPLSEIIRQNQESLNGLVFFNIDVEGMELEVLKTNDWSRYRPVLVLVEILEEEKYADIDQFLRGVGYHFVARTKNTFFYAEENFKRCYVD